MEARQIHRPISIDTGWARPVKQDLSAVDSPRGLENTQDGVRCDGFTTSTFTDDAKDLATPQGQIYTFYCPNEALVQRKGYPQIFDF